MVVQHNMPAQVANRYYTQNNSTLSKSLEKLSSGYSINRAGDNAAGLAVSEKMRAQISGLTQASKNAEDGISMVQTYEGALQETDSILQRMRTIAVQSANGSYADDVDRDALQLEFDQLNDELNQIADTDFNGVIVLNGGEMADGTRAVNNKFDYTNNTRNEKQLSSKDVNLVDEQVVNNASTTTGCKTKSDDVWKALFSSANVNRTNATTSDDGPESFEVTLKYDANATSANDMWKVTDTSNGADQSAITVTGTNNGGFKLTTASVDWANVVIDQSDLKNGDTITLTYTNPAAAISAPTNAGATRTTNASGSFTEGTDANAVKLNEADLKVAIDSGVTDTAMTSNINKIFDKFNGAQFEMTYNAAAATAATDVKISGDGWSYTGNATGAQLDLGDGVKCWAATDANGKVTISTVNGTAAGTTLFTLEPTKQSSATNGSSGKVTYKIGFDNNSYDDSKKPSVTVKEPNDASVSKSNAFEQSKASMTYTDNMTLQVGARTKDMVEFKFSYASGGGIGELEANMNCSAREDGLGTSGLSVSDQKSANDAIDKIDNAINKVSMVRATFGAIQNRLEHKISNLNTNAENLTAAESRIRDTQMDQEMMKFTSAQILSQASQSMLAQANSLPQGVLQLLG